MKSKPASILWNSFFVLILWTCGLSHAAEGGLQAWAIGEGVRINPLTGKAFEENATQLPNGISGDYRSKNWIWDGATQTITLQGAANEVVGFQLILEGSGVKGITVTSEDLKGASASIPSKQFEFFRAFYVKISPKADAKRAPFPLDAGWYADPLMPLSNSQFGAPFAIDGSNFGGTRPDATSIKNQTVWGDLWIPKKTPKGNYEGKIIVKSESHAVELNLKLEVFDFEMPDENHSTLEFMSYSTFAGLDKADREAAFKLAHRHRINITTTKPLLNYTPELVPDASGTKLVWEGFDQTYGPIISGALYTEGPRAGVPMDFFLLPFDPKLDRPDAKGNNRGVGWPIPNTTINKKHEVEFTPEYVDKFKALLKDASEHFAEKYPKTTILIYQDSLDEPGFHKAKQDVAMGQMRSIQGYIKICNELNLKNVEYKLDIGGGFNKCKFDLDGNGKNDGTKEVVAALAGSGIWSIHGMCIDLEALKPEIQNGAKVWFYNGFEPRVGPTTIGTEAIGPRTWQWVAFNSGIHGSCQWSFQQGTKAKDGDKPWTKGGATSKNPHAGDAMFIYPGDELGLPNQAFPSMRLKAYRRGLQDYEYMHLLSQKTSVADVMKISTAAVWSVMSGKLDMKDFQDDAAGEEATVKVEGDQRAWTHNPEIFEQVRGKMGAMIKETKP